jgi:hypothetical protein
VWCDAVSGLGRLILVYDDNSITIDGETHLSFSGFQAYYSIRTRYKCLLLKKDCLLWISLHSPLLKILTLITPFVENVPQRFQSYGWHTLTVEDGCVRACFCGLYVCGYG